MQEEKYKYVVLGGGVAAGYAADQFVKEYKARTGREHCSNEVVVISDDITSPYERPALTKGYLHPPEAKSRARVPNFSTTVGSGGEKQIPEWYGEHGIILKLRTKCISFDPENNSITVRDKDTKAETVIFYEIILLATGVEPRDMGETNRSKNVFTIKGVSDCDELIKKLENKRTSNVVVIGGGFIAIEAACVISGWIQSPGTVTLVCRGKTLLDSFLPPEHSDYLEQHILATRPNIRIMREATVKDMIGDKSKMLQVTVSSKVDGVVQKENVRFDLAVLGIGSKMRSFELYRKKILLAPSPIFGIKVDESLRSIVYKNVYVLGDISAIPVELSRRKADYVYRHERHEHVSHARATARYAVKHIFGVAAEKFESDVFFYSRMFEYTDTPIKFEFYGDLTDFENKRHMNNNVIYFNREMAKNYSMNFEFGAVWVKDGAVCAGIVWNDASGKTKAKLQYLVARAAKLSDATETGVLNLLAGTNPEENKPALDKRASKVVVVNQPLKKNNSFYFKAQATYQNL